MGDRQARQAFREEAQELLSELEAALLELDGKRNDLELVGSNAVGVILTGMGDDGASGMSR